MKTATKTLTAKIQACIREHGDGINELIDARHLVASLGEDAELFARVMYRLNGQERHLVRVAPVFAETGAIPYNVVDLVIDEIES